MSSGNADRCLCFEQMASLCLIAKIGGRFKKILQIIIVLILFIEYIFTTLLAFKLSKFVLECTLLAVAIYKRIH